LDYIWQTYPNPNQGNQIQITTSMNPFSPQLSLPYLTALNNIVERLVTFQLVRFVNLAATSANLLDRLSINIDDTPWFLVPGAR
jgi:hypothetical protein